MIRVATYLEKWEKSSGGGVDEIVGEIHEKLSKKGKNEIVLQMSLTL